MKLQWLVIPRFVKSGIKGLNTGCCDQLLREENSTALQLVGYSETEFPDVQS